MTEFFEDMYRKSPDPWNFASSEYELGRYAAILSALGSRQFHRAFEPGCSIGVLTEKLASRCAHIDAMDLSPTAIALAQQRCRALPNVSLAVGSLPENIPPASFDLIVFSEIGYYFPLHVLRVIALELIDRLEPDGIFLAVHWLGLSKDHISLGDQVHDVLLALPGLVHEADERTGGFRLDVWKRDN